MKPEISLSPTAVRQIEAILTSGKGVEMRVVNGHLVIWETSSKKQYDVMVTSR